MGGKKTRDQESIRARFVFSHCIERASNFRFKADKAVWLKNVKEDHVERNALLLYLVFEKRQT